MTTNQPQRPETFIVGEKVVMLIGEHEQEVHVVSVDGDKVRVVTYFGQVREFVARKSDGRHVSPEHMEAVVMPDMIAHFREVTAPRQSFWNRVKSFMK